MDIKIKDLLDKEKSWSKLIGCDALPVKAKYRISRTFKKVQSALRDFYEEQNDLAKAFGVKNEALKRYTIAKTDEHYQEYFEQYKELIAKVVEIDVMTVKLSDTTGAKLTSMDYAELIGFLIDEPTDAEIALLEKLEKSEKEQEA